MKYTIIWHQSFVSYRLVSRQNGHHFMLYQFAIFFGGGEGGKRQHNVVFCRIFKLFSSQAAINHQKTRKPAINNVTHTYVQAGEGAPPSTQKF